MNDLEKFLDGRKNEIEQFFQFLMHLQIDQNNSYTVSVYGDSMEDENVFELNHTHTQIFKSNCFLLLYNILEGTVFKSLEFILDKIKDEELSYQEVLKEIQEIWLKSQFPKGTNLDEIEHLKIFERMDNLLHKKVEIDLITFRDKNRGYFGKSNLNDDVIHNELFPKIGIKLTNKISESKLDDIKNKRNNLAHGGTSFSELGQTVSFRELIQYKDKTFKYLEKFVHEISEYVSSKKYKVI